MGAIGVVEYLIRWTIPCSCGNKSIGVVKQCAEEKLENLFKFNFKSIKIYIIKCTSLLISKSKIAFVLTLCSFKLHYLNLCQGKIGQKKFTAAVKRNKWVEHRTNMPHCYNCAAISIESEASCIKNK